VLVRNDISIATVGITANQISVGTAIAAGGATNSLNLALLPQSDASVRQAFNQLSGDIHASLRSAAVEDSRMIRNIVLDHLGKSADGIVAWGAGFGGYGSISSDGNASGLHHDSAGVIAGADVPLDGGFRLGFAGAYTANNARVADRSSTANGNSGHIIAYGGWIQDAIDLKLGSEIGWGTANVTRTVASFSQSDANSQSQRVAQIFGDAGYKIVTAQATLEPYLNIASVSAMTGGFAESGGSTALSGGSKTDTETYETLGMRASLAGMTLDDRVGLLSPHIDMGWQHAFNVFQPAQILTFQSLAQNFTVLGVPLSRDAAAVRAGADLVIGPDATLSLDYDGSFASRVQNNAIRGTLAWRF
jgi:fibronectin-binding autotransporter adhesin